MQAPGTSPIPVHVVNRGAIQLTHISINEVDGRWILAGHLRYRRGYPITRTRKTLHLTAEDTTGKTSFECFITVKLTPTTTRFKASSQGTFRAPIPDPDTLTRLTLVLGAPEEDQD